MSGRNPLTGKYVEDLFGCWTFTGALNGGYGRMWDKATKKVDYAHRIAYRHFHGPIGDGLQVRHRCSTVNKACVNPDHLVEGTPLENHWDAVEDGAMRVKLNANRVRFIRAMEARGDHDRELTAELLGISVPTVKDVANGRSWTWVEPLPMPQEPKAKERRRPA